MNQVGNRLYIYFLLDVEHQMLFNPGINLKLVKQIQAFYISNRCLFLLSKLTSSMIATAVSVSRSSKLVKLISDISSKL